MKGNGRQEKKGEGIEGEEEKAREAK